MLHLSLIRRKPSAIDRATHALALNLVRMFGLSAGDAGQVVARRLPRPLTSRPQRRFLARLDSYRRDGPPPRRKRMTRQEIRAWFST